MSYFEKVLIRADNLLFTTANGILEQLNETEPTADLFQAFGSNELPTWDLIGHFTNPEVLLWKIEDNAPAPPYASAVMTAYPGPQIIKSGIDNFTNAGVYGIGSVDITYEGNPLFACSFDGGTVWEIYNGTEWIEVQSENIGMTADEIIAITTDQWAERFTESGSLQMRVLLSTIYDSLTDLTINYIN